MSTRKDAVYNVVVFGPGTHGHGHHFSRSYLPRQSVPETMSMVKHGFPMDSLASAALEPRGPGCLKSEILRGRIADGDETKQGRGGQWDVQERPGPWRLPCLSPQCAIPEAPGGSKKVAGMAFERRVCGIGKYFCTCGGMGFAIATALFCLVWVGVCVYFLCGQRRLLAAFGLDIQDQQRVRQ